MHRDASQHENERLCCSIVSVINNRTENRIVSFSVTHVSGAYGGYSGRIRLSVCLFACITAITTILFMMKSYTEYTKYTDGVYAKEERKENNTNQ